MHKEQSTQGRFVFFKARVAIVLPTGILCVLCPLLNCSKKPPQPAGPFACFAPYVSLREITRAYPANSPTMLKHITPSTISVINTYRKSRSSKNAKADNATRIIGVAIRHTTPSWIISMP